MMFGQLLGADHPPRLFREIIMRVRTFLSIVVALDCLVGCSPSQTSSTASQHQRVGGYALHAVDSTVIACANFAVQQQPIGTVKLLRVVQAERQVVAGMNYRLQLLVQHNGMERNVQALVWRKLDGSRELSSWDWE
jgi:hypothetical protein